VFLYNNCDTIVLGKVLEAVTRTPFLSLANRTIGEPLGVSLTLPDEPRGSKRRSKMAARNRASGRRPTDPLAGSMERLQTSCALMRR